MTNAVLLSLSLLLSFSCKSTSFAGGSKSPSHETWNTLLRKHVTEAGNVHYKSFQSDSIELQKYLKLLSNNPPNETIWTVNEQKAYWINAYNAFTIQLVLKYYPLKSIKDIGSSIQIPFVNTPWDVKFISIGNEKMDLNNIEHGQLRKKFDDPRIHFAIVCASKSCPVLLNEAYDPARLEQQLDKQAKVFLADTFRNKIAADKIQLSKIFDWFKGDFTKNGSLIDYLNKYALVKINANAENSYLDYDWSLNE
ncbi:MAG: DUF547 domain-containing protein [Bacteroidota bacterium]|nr:DUF547 domain-containing protein [Bacteroidota bacterium]